MRHVIGTIGVGIDGRPIRIHVEDRNSRTIISLEIRSDSTGGEPMNVPKGRRGMTLAELRMAMSITVLVGAGVLAMMETIGRVLDDGRSQRAETIASATAASRLSSVVAPSACALELSPELVTLWSGDARRDGAIQASELVWIRYETESETLRVENVRFPDEYGTIERNESDQTFELDQDFQAVRIQYEQQGHLESRVLLDGIEDIQLAMPSGDVATPVEQGRVAWRIGWNGDIELNGGTVIACGIHAHHNPEDS